MQGFFALSFRVWPVSRSCRIVVFGEAPAAGAPLPVVYLAADDDFQAVLDKIAADGADCLLLANCRGADDLQRCDIGLTVAEARAGRMAGAIGIIAGIADSAIGLMRARTLGGKSARLRAVTWNRASFCADVGCRLDSTIAEHARIEVLVTARALALPAYDCLGEGQPAADLAADARSFGFDGYWLAAD